MCVKVTVRVLNIVTATGMVLVAYGLIPHLPYFLANKPTRQMSQDQLLALKMKVLPCYHPISRGRKFDRHGAAPD